MVTLKVSGDTLRAMSAALVLSEPLTHRALDRVVGHRSSVSIRRHVDDWPQCVWAYEALAIVPGGTWTTARKKGGFTSRR